MRLLLLHQDTHDTVKVQTQPQYTKAGTINYDCPSGYKAFSCYCYSPWGNCYGDAFGFSPSNDESGKLVRCSHTSDSNRMLSAICVKNT